MPSYKVQSVQIYIKIHSMIFEGTGANRRKRWITPAGTVLTLHLARTPGNPVALGFKGERLEFKPAPQCADTYWKLPKLIPNQHYIARVSAQGYMQQGSWTFGRGVSTSNPAGVMEYKGSLELHKK